MVAIVPGACVALHVASSSPRGTRADELTAAIARVVGALLAWASAATLLDARVASSWGESITRAARVAEVLRTAREADALAVAGVAMVLLTAGVGAWRAASVPSTSWRPTRAGATLAMIAAAGCAVDLTFLAQMRSRRAALWSALAPAFELGARLSPPVAVGLPRPPLGPSLQLTVDRVAIDGTPVALTRALDTLEGQRVLAADLSHRLARGGATEAAELIVAVDASVPWRAVREALTVARDLGARRATFLFTRGATPVIERGAPPEAGYSLPTDFGGLTVTLATDGSRYDDDSPFAAVGASLVRSHPRSVSVAR